MFYEKITQQELDAMERPDGITPNYTYETCIENKDKDTGEVVEKYYINLTIRKTADEVYQESLINKPSKPDEMEVLQQQLKQQETAIGLLATQIAKNTLLQNGGMK